MTLFGEVKSDKYTPTGNPLEDVVGYTLAEGGGTFNATLQPIMYSHGFLVGVRGIVVPIPFFTSGLVSNFCNEYDLGGPKALLGTWVSEEAVYLDITMHVTSLEHARELARIYNQKAIFDCAAGESIWLETGEHY